MIDNSNDQKKRYTLYDPSEVLEFHLSKNEEAMDEFRLMSDADKVDMALWSILELELTDHHEKMGILSFGRAVDDLCHTLMVYFRKYFREEGPTKEDHKDLAIELFKQLVHIRQVMSCVANLIPPNDFEQESKAFREEFAAWKAKNDAAKSDEAKADNA